MSKNKILVIIPTKERLGDFEIFANSWLNTTEGKSDVLVAIDEDDTTYDSIKEKYPFIFETVEHRPFIEILNGLANKYCYEYDYIAFMEDDCTFNTYGWETAFINKLIELGDNGIVWGNDLLNKDYIVGLPFMNSKIIQNLGYMAPYELKYLFVDHFWKRIGVELNSLYYFNDIIIEHRHYSTGKRTKDEISAIVDERGKLDHGHYMWYINNKLQSDLNKLRK